MTPADFKTQANAVHAQLRDEAARLRASLDETRWRLFASVESAVETALGIFDGGLRGLAPDGASTARVISGERSAAWWEAQADVLRGSISYVAKSLGESVPTWSRVVGEIIKPSATEFVDVVATGVDAVADVLPWWVPWAIGGGLTLGVVVLAGIYLPKPRGN